MIAHFGNFIIALENSAVRQPNGERLLLNSKGIVPDIVQDCHHRLLKRVAIMSVFMSGLNLC